ncbi:MAG: hypothetical protein ACK4QW_07125 [Alphaproteobacteria bacterium]
MRRHLVWTVAVLFAAGPGAAAADAWPSRSSADRESGYAGGRGLISYSGQTGMFLNPTSGTARAGDLSLQSCALVFGFDGKTVVSHAGLATYGVTDWLEIGLFGIGVYGAPKDAGGPGSGPGGPGPGPGPGPGGGPGGGSGIKSTMGAAQGNLRLRLLKDEGGLPEISVGGMYRAGDGWLRQEQLFVAASKGFDLDPAGPVRAIRFHAGFRQLWQDRNFRERDGSIVFGGIDVALPWNLHLVGEVSSKDDVYPRTPFSVGIQWRDPRGFGASLAFVRSDDWGEDGAYVGIGFNF